jgi:CRP-like cAMP-binding protein
MECRLQRECTPGSVFGEQAVLLDQPHTADVRTLEQSEFYVADGKAVEKVEELLSYGGRDPTGW